MPKLKKGTYVEHEEIGHALRWFREQRRNWTRVTLIEQLKEQGMPMSMVYLTKIENGDRTRVTNDKMTALLKALGSNLTEMEALLEHRPWSHMPEGQAKLHSGNVSQEMYQMAAADALSSFDGDTWSDNVGDPTEQARLQGQAVELVEHFVRLSAKDRAKFLKDIRKKRYGN